MKKLNDFLEGFKEQPNDETQKETKKEPLFIKEEKNMGNLFNNKDEEEKPKVKKLNFKLKTKDEIDEKVELPKLEVLEKVEEYKIEKEKEIIIKEKDYIEKLFIKSETPIEYKQKWFELHEKAMNSDKNTKTNDKVRRGKFRFDDFGELEILPEYETFEKTCKDVLHDIWLLPNKEV